MATLYGRTWTREELLRKIGDVSQLGGAESVELQEGRARGVRAVRFSTGVLDFTVLPDRCLDIYSVSFRGVPLDWRSPAGLAAPSYFEDEGLRLLRTYQGGLLITCGLTSIGAPSVDQGEELGLHGRVHSLPATNVHVDGAWQGDEYVMWIEGKVRQATVFGENLVLRRRISARLGEAKILISDTIENEGYHTVPHMILYHTNLGFPLVDEGAELLIASRVTPRDDEAKKGHNEWHRFGAPVHGYAEQAFYHDATANDEGFAVAGLVNRGFEGGRGLGLYVKYNKATLPLLQEWKMMGEGTYVVGLSPANGMGYGRATARAQGNLQYLEPGERRQYDVEFGVLAEEAEICALAAQVQALRKDG